MSYKRSSIIKQFIIFITLIGFALLSFEILYKAFDIGKYRAPLSLNVKLHKPNEVLTAQVSEALSNRSNDSLKRKKFKIRTGDKREILGKKTCPVSKKIIYAIGSSTTEQKLIDEGKRWVDVLNQFKDGTNEYCIKNYGYGGVNLLHATDSLYYLNSLELPSAVILMSNATDVGQLMRYGSYNLGTNNISKKRLIIDGVVKKYDSGFFSGLKHLLEKLLGKEIFTKNLGKSLPETDRDKSKMVQMYLDQFLKFKRQLIAHDIPLLYIAEPRIPKLSDLSPKQSKLIAKNYLASGVDYEQMSSLHKSFTVVIEEEIKQSKRGCFLDTDDLNKAEYIYDEGHLNEMGSKLLADLIVPFIGNISNCN